MAQSVWDSLCRTINPLRGHPRIGEVSRYGSQSFELEVSKLRPGIHSTTALTIHTGRDIVQSFWILTDELLAKIAGASLANRWYRARQHTEFATHFQEIFDIARSFFLPSNQNVICSFVGHSVAWNEASSQKSVVDASTLYLSRAIRNDEVEEGARRKFRFGQNHSPVRFSPGRLSWSHEYYRSEKSHRSFTWYRHKRIFKLPTDQFTQQSDITVFYKGDFATDAADKPSTIAGPYHTASIYKHQATASTMIEDAIFFDVIHLELTRFIFCNVCEAMKFPSLFRDSIYLALDPEDFGVLCIAATEQPAFTAGSTQFTSSTYGRCLKKL